MGVVPSFSGLGVGLRGWGWPFGSGWFFLLVVGVGLSGRGWPFGSGWFFLLVVVEGDFFSGGAFFFLLFFFFSHSESCLEFQNFVGKIDFHKCVGGSEEAPGWEKMRNEKKRKEVNDKT